MKLKTLPQKNLKNKAILLRVDINSPAKESQIIDNPRFQAAAKTINHLLTKKAKLTIIAHQGRPKSKDFLPLRQHAKLLSKYTKTKINYVNDIFKKEAQKAISSLKPGQAILLKNVRIYKSEFYPKKDKNYKPFCAQFDFYINDAFSVSHRNQSSLILPPKYLPSFISQQFQQEITALQTIFHTKSKKTIFVLGGAKVDDYFPIFDFLKNKKNKILAAGLLGSLFLIISGKKLGFEENWIKKMHLNKTIPHLSKIYNKYKSQIVLPIDFGLITRDNKRIKVSLNDIPFKHKIFDIGPKTVKLFKQNLKQTDQIFMKGPLGYSQTKEFSYGTRELLNFVSKQKNKFRIIGGGHLTTTLEKYKIHGSFNHVSLSGGALLEFISGKKLPAITALEKSPKQK